MQYWKSICLVFALHCGMAHAGTADVFRGKEAFPGVMLLTGWDLQPFQTQFSLPELADPYVTLFPDGAVISGTAQYHLKFDSVDDISRGGPYRIEWREFFHADGSPLEANRLAAHSWDMKPVLWARSPKGEGASPRLWEPGRDRAGPVVVWYGGRMRRRPGAAMARWPADNFSRDVFAFVERQPGRWISNDESLFSLARDWPRVEGNYLGHRYGHQIVMIPKKRRGRKRQKTAAVFYEQVTAVRSNGSPAETAIFSDEMATPFQAQGRPVKLISPINPATGKAYPSTIREDGSALVEGPLYFRFRFEGEEWEAIGFSAGSFYGKYPSAFASRRVRDGFLGKPYRLDLTDDGSDLRDAGAELGARLNLAGGPGRPAVIVGSDGEAIRGPDGGLQILVHAYRKDILPDNDWDTTSGKYRSRYRFDQMFRVMIHASLRVERGPRGAPRFTIVARNGKASRYGTCGAGKRHHVECNALQSHLSSVRAPLAGRNGSIGDNLASHRSGF